MLEITPTPSESGSPHSSVPVSVSSFAPQSDPPFVEDRDSILTIADDDDTLTEMDIRDRLAKLKASQAAPQTVRDITRHQARYAMVPPPPLPSDTKPETDEPIEYGIIPGDEVEDLPDDDGIDSRDIELLD